METEVRRERWTPKARLMKEGKEWVEAHGMTDTRQFLAVRRRHKALCFVRCGLHAVGVDIPPLPASAGRDSPARRRAREHLASTLWDPRGRRRLPPGRVLAAAIDACDPRDVWWVCESTAAGPLYLLPTREWLTALCAFVDAWKVKRVLEVAAGDGFLSACLRRRRPDLVVTATDDMSWTRASHRQGKRDVKEFKGVAFAGIRPDDQVLKLGAVAAVERFRPALTIVSWAPPGLLVERVIRAPSSKLVLDLSVDGDVCGNGMATWRFEKEFLDGDLETRALCRLDAGHQPRATRATLYFGRAHRRFAVDAP